MQVSPKTVRNRFFDQCGHHRAVVAFAWVSKKLFYISVFVNGRTCFVNKISHLACLFMISFDAGFHVEDAKL